MQLRRAILAAACITALLTAACDAGPADVITPPAEGAAAVTVVDGNHQAGTVGEALPQEIVVRVVDGDGAPSSGVGVNFSVQEGGGTLSRSSVTTGADGLASVEWTLGTVAGAVQTVSASAAGKTASFSATANAGPVAGLSLAPDSLAFETVGQTAQLVAEAVDQYGNQVNDPSVTWATSDTAVVRVDASGSVQAAGPGSARIRAASDSTASSIPVTVRIDIPETTVVLDTANTDLLSDSSEVAAGTLRFRVDGVHAVEVGDVVVGTHGAGFLREVVSVSSTGNVLSLGTKQASMTQAIENGSFAGRSIISLGEGSSAMSPEPGRISWGETRLVHAAAGLSNVSGGFSLDGIQLFEGDGLTVEIPAGAIQFSPEVEVAAEIADYSVADFRATVAGPMTVSTGLKITASREQSRSGSLILATFRKPFYAQIGPVPVPGVVELSLVASYSVGVGAEGSVLAAVSRTDHIRVGATYGAAGWSPVGDITQSVSERTVEWGAGMETQARLAVRPQVRVMLYDVVGPEISLGPYSTFAGRIDLQKREWSSTLVAGIDGHVGVVAEVISDELGSYDIAIPGVSEVVHAATGHLPVDSIIVEPAAVSLLVGATRALEANGYYGGSRVEFSQPLVWTSDDPDIATVNSSGVVQAVARGTTTIRVVEEGTPTESQTVTSVQVTVTDIASLNLVVFVGGSGWNDVQTWVGSENTYGSLSARDENGRELSLENRVITWESSNPEVVAIGEIESAVNMPWRERRYIRPTNVGEAVVRVTVDGVSIEQNISVYPDLDGTTWKGNWELSMPYARNGKSGTHVFEPTSTVTIEYSRSENTPSRYRATVTVRADMQTLWGPAQDVLTYSTMVRPSGRFSGPRQCDSGCFNIDYGFQVSLTGEFVPGGEHAFEGTIRAAVVGGDAGEQVGTTRYRATRQQ